MRSKRHYPHNSDLSMETFPKKGNASFGTPTVMTATLCFALFTTGCHFTSPATSVAKEVTNQTSVVSPKPDATTVTMGLFPSKIQTIFGVEGIKGVRSPAPDATDEANGANKAGDARPKNPLPVPDPHRIKTPEVSGAGLIVCEPVPVPNTANNGNDAIVAFAAGCADWLYIAVAGQPELGQTPLLTSVHRACRELKLHDGLRLSEEQARQVADMTGATHVAIGTISPQGSGDVSKLTYSLVDVHTGKPVGKEIVATGTPAQLRASLPVMAAEMTAQLGIAKPSHLPTAVDASEAELTALGRVMWNPNPSAVDCQSVRNAAEHVVAANLCALSMNRWDSEDSGSETDGPTFAARVQSLLTRLAPINALAWGHVAYLDSTAPLPYKAKLAELRKQFPHCYALAHADIWTQRAGGDARTERRAAEDAARSAPKNPDAWLALGYTLGHEAHAVRRARTIGAIGERDHVYLNQMYAAWVFTTLQATQRDPKHEVAWDRLAEAATFAGDESVAREAFWKSEANAPNKADAYDWGLQMFQSKWGGSPSDLAEVARRAREADYPTVESVGRIADHLKAAGCDADAQALLTRYVTKVDAYLEQEPQDGRAHWQKASLIMHLGKKSAACQEYREAVRLLPDNANVQYDLAVALDDAGADATCIPAYQKVLKMKPDHLMAPIRLGFALKRTGKITEAEKYLREGLARFPNSREGHFALGEIYAMRQQYVQAAPEFRQVIAQGGVTPMVYGALTGSLTESGQVQEAIRWGEEGVGRYASYADRMPREVEWLHMSLAWAYLKAKRYSDAIRENQAAIFLNPTDMTARVNLGFSLNALERRTEGRKQWQFVIDHGSVPREINEARRLMGKYPENGR